MKVGLFQMCSVLEPEINMNKILQLKNQLKEHSIEALFLPECFYSMSDGEQLTPYLIEENNQHMENIKSLGSELGVYIIGGSAATKENGKIFNRTYNITPERKLLPYYDKNHLFACNLEDKISSNIKKRFNESDHYTPGEKITLLNLNSISIGLSICFDLRFPELYKSYIQQGAHVLTVASAFTIPTGKAHWEILLKARAIENQCYVIASAQVGKNSKKIHTYGHSMIIDPWGDILCHLENKEGLEVADIDLEKITTIRNKIKMT